MTDVVADAYATMAEFRLYVRSAATSDATDTDTGEHLAALEAARAIIDTHCNRTFKVATAPATVRYFSARYVRPASSLAWMRAECPIDDVSDATGLTVAFDETGNGGWGSAITTYRLTPLDAAGRNRPYTGLLFDSGTAVPIGTDRIKVTAIYSYAAAIPKPIKQANLLQAARLLKRRDAPFGVAGSPEMGNELRLLAQLDPDVKVILAPFKRYF